MLVKSFSYCGNFSMEIFPLGLKSFTFAHLLINLLFVSWRKFPGSPTSVIVLIAKLMSMDGVQIGNIVSIFESV